MKCTVVIFSVLLLVLLKHAKALQEESMDTLKSTIYLYAPDTGSFSSGILKSHNGISYTPNRNKTLTVAAPLGYSLMVAIRYIDFRSNRQDVLTLSGDQTAPRTYSNNLSYKNKRYYPMEDETYYVPYGNLRVTFSTGPYFTYGYDGFELIYTVQAQSGLCKSSYFVCDNGRCIASILKCNGHNHCGDGSSQEHCFFPRTKPGKVIGIVSGCAFLLIAVACGIYVVCRRRNYTERRTVITSHPPPQINQPPMYPYPPPPYNQGVTNPVYH